MYINQILPKKWSKVPKIITIKINLRHIMKGDFELMINKAAKNRHMLAIVIKVLNAILNFLY